uniref:Uncharacterized protein n=1 Tax=Ficedula albicollis TaxID=59894 RepID=A0A803W116_FICAL
MHLQVATGGSCSGVIPAEEQTWLSANRTCLSCPFSLPRALRAMVPQGITELVFCC